MPIKTMLVEFSFNPRKPKGQQFIIWLEDLKIERMKFNVGIIIVKDVQNDKKLTDANKAKVKKINEKEKSATKRAANDKGAVTAGAYTRSLFGST